jgi:hypothetical protein
VLIVAGKMLDRDSTRRSQGSCEFLWESLFTAWQYKSVVLSEFTIFSSETLVS